MQTNRFFLQHESYLEALLICWYIREHCVYYSVSPRHRGPLNLISVSTVPSQWAPCIVVQSLLCLHTATETYRTKWNDTSLSLVWWLPFAGMLWSGAQFCRWYSIGYFIYQSFFMETLPIRKIYFCRTRIQSHSISRRDIPLQRQRAILPRPPDRNSSFELFSTMKLLTSFAWHAWLWSLQTRQAQCWWPRQQRRFTPDSLVYCVVHIKQRLQHVSKSMHYQMDHFIW